jgi:hypothetical protein
MKLDELHIIKASHRDMPSEEDGGNGQPKEREMQDA